MRHRIFVDRIEPATVVTGEEFHHSVRVVRLRDGEEVELFDRTGASVRATVAAVDRDRAVFVAGEPLASREAKTPIHLAMAIIQLEKFELVLQKATELGVRTIIPLETERIEIRRERYAGKSERWERIIYEAVKQSGRTLFPMLEPPASLETVLGRPGSFVLFDADAEPAAATAGTDGVTLLIGPEGGWSEDELVLARSRGCMFRRLGPRRLRAETAAIAATAIIAAECGEL